LSAVTSKNLGPIAKLGPIPQKLSVRHQDFLFYLFEARGREAQRFCQVGEDLEPPFRCGGRADGRLVVLDYSTLALNGLGQT
jgi:hypothetical protein